MGAIKRFRMGLNVGETLQCFKCNRFVVGHTPTLTKPRIYVYLEQAIRDIEESIGKVFCVKCAKRENQFMDESMTMFPIMERDLE